MEENKPDETPGEDKPVPKKEEKAKSLLQEAREERVLMEKARDEAREERGKLEQLKAEEVIAGKTDAGQKPEEKKEETPQEYKDRVMRNEV